MKNSLPILLLCSIPLIHGCATEPSRIDAGFGEAVRQARAIQVVYPDRRAASGEPVGIDARSAVSSIDQYQESFKAPPKTFGVLGVGGGLSISGQ
ncbi:MAG: hypothetical protein RIS35_1558 [Pseudomonadota bacterium]|jgi:hypothetical protein